ncbi:MarR family transcriptional regulator [Achromobacter sp. GG226]|uniref:MarR family winged helix-turn-helix transcriptional regulator n=1 Tax=Verticiella alkaliphila TaxID=2779529 RepID=UPI001C0E40CE|nr:MarR family transcriptional regulator [Verticiella sp. GG226]MBU4609671.1 MarR family transcriptional regulator [Verticiella sp. GG226]
MTDSPASLPVPGPLDAQLCFSLYAANLAMHKTYRGLLAELGLTYPQYLVMLVLWQQDGLTVSQLGAQLRLDSATLTPLLKRLASAGLLVRERGVADERQVVIRLTDAGRALRAPAGRVAHGIACAVGCSRDEADALRTQLDALRHRLDGEG